MTEKVRFRRLCAGLSVALIFPAILCAQRQSRPRASAPNKNSAEEQTERSLQVAKENPLQLRHFLLGMPKGADLHVHLSGAVYAESFIRAAAEDHLCVNQTSLAFAKPQPDKDDSSKVACEAGAVPVEQAYKDQHLYDAMVDAFSMRDFVPTPGVSGHDHFFDTFAKFAGTDPRHLAEWLDEVATRAAAQNEQYLEVMQTPVFRHAATIAIEIGWKDDFGKLRDELLSRGLRDEISAASAELDRAETLRKQREHCGEEKRTAACAVDVRYIYQILRGFPKEQVFAQTLLGFETASADARFVGINLVMPEDGYVSMNDYALHMRMVGFFHSVYPKIHISLHAGELAPGLVPYEGLCCHIRLAVEQGHAERIGHGADIAYEDHPHELLKKMAANHLMVEVNLTSNDVILGVSGKNHPLSLYRLFGVPFALATDDEGVSRIDLTHEYVKAVTEQGLRYVDLKRSARTSLEHSFLPGASLWNAPDVFSQHVSACSKDSPSATKASAGCESFLKGSEKARQQWELERRFIEFEKEN
jgi:adenosine deaminase